VVERVTGQLTSAVSPDDLARSLLKPSQAAGLTDQQLAVQVRTLIADATRQIITSSEFTELWRTTNQTAHQELVRQIRSNADSVTLDLSPAVNGILNQIRQTQLATFADKIKLAQNVGKLTIKTEALSQTHQYYTWFQAATIAVVALTLLLGAAAVWLSVHHLKTLRRMFVGTGLIALTLAALLQLPRIGLLDKGLDPAAQAAVVAIIETLFRDLVFACLALGGGCILTAFGIKLYEHYHRSHTPSTLTFRN
jgi:hypothetical protein